MVNLYIEVTTICNAKCPHCPLRKKGEMKNRVMSLETFRSIILSFKQYFNKVGVIISGGEPSLLPNLREYVSEAKKLGCAVTVITNGTNIDNVIASNPDIIEISFDSFTKCVENKIYGVPIFTKKLIGLIKASELHSSPFAPIVIVRYTLTKDNFTECIILRSFLDRLDRSIPMFVVPIKGVPEKRPTPEQLKTLNTIDNIFLENYCPAGKSFFAIDIDGNIMSCFITRHKIGHISNIKEAIENGKKVKEFECEDDPDYIQLLKSLRKRNYK